MPRDTYPIVEEYVRAPDPQVRMNALTALASLGTKQSVERLAHHAVTDDDKSVRRHAAAELMEIEDERLVRDAYAALIGWLDDEHDDFQVRAYRLMGHLRGQHRSLSSVPATIGRRLKIAGFIHRKHYSQRSTLRFRFRGLPAGIFGGAVGALLLWVFLAVSGTDLYSSASVVSWLAVSGIILAPIIGVLLSQCSVPAYIRSTDLRMGLAAELGWVFLSGIAVIVALLMAMIMIDAQMPSWSTALPELAFLAVAVVGFACIRLTTILAYGASAEPRMNESAQMAAGGIVGSALLTLMVLAADEIHSVEALWVSFIPLSFGLASTFARVDNERYRAGSVDEMDEFQVKPTPLWGWSGRRLVQGLLALSFLVVAVLVYDVRTMSSSAEAAEQVVPAGLRALTRIEGQRPGGFRLPNTESRVDTLVYVPSLPASITFSVSEARNISLQALNYVPPSMSEYSPVNVDLRLNRISEAEARTGVTDGDVVAYAQYPPAIFRRLEEGSYALMVSEMTPSATTHRVEDVLRVVRERIADEDLARTDAVGGFVLWFSNTVTDAESFERRRWALSDSLESPAKVHAMIRQYESFDASRYTGYQANTVCWSGSLYGFHEDSVVRDACEQAVLMDPSDTGSQDSRGLNRALNGDLRGAADDFRAYAERTDMYTPEQVQRRLEWVSALEEGTNPITPEVLKDLRANEPASLTLY